MFFARSPGHLYNLGSTAGDSTAADMREKLRNASQTQQRFLSVYDILQVDIYIIVQKCLGLHFLLQQGFFFSSYFKHTRRFNERDHNALVKQELNSTTQLRGMALPTDSTTIWKVYRRIVSFYVPGNNGSGEKIKRCLKSAARMVRYKAGRQHSTKCLLLLCVVLFASLASSVLQMLQCEVPYRSSSCLSTAITGVAPRLNTLPLSYVSEASPYASYVCGLFPPLPGLPGSIRVGDPTSLLPFLNVEAKQVAGTKHINQLYASPVLENKHPSLNNIADVRYHKRVRGDGKSLRTAIGSVCTSGESRRLSGLIGRTIKRVIAWRPHKHDLKGLNLNQVVLIAGKHTGYRSAAFQTKLEDALILFFRWFDSTSKGCAWPLQGLISKEALLRSHEHYGQQTVRSIMRKQEEFQKENEEHLGMLQPYTVYRRLGAAERFITNWFFDGNTLHRRGRAAFDIPEELTEFDVLFMHGLPLSMLRVAGAVNAANAPASVKRLESELALRGIRSLERLLSHSNFFDLFVLFDIFDEVFAQIDVLREFVSNWNKFNKGEFKPVNIPLGHWKEKDSIYSRIASVKEPVTEFPKCTTLKCLMRWTWKKTPERIVKVKKSDVNSLKLLLIGSTGVGSYSAEDAQKNFFYKLRHALSSDTLEQTVTAMKDWHIREKADAVLGLGDILGMPGPTSVRDPSFEKKWYNLFVQNGGLDVPWLMTIGDEEAVLNPSSLVRYHHSHQHSNWHMPNNFYTVTFQFETSLTLTTGRIHHENFNATVISIDTWALLAGNPLANNMENWTDNLMWLSEQLYKATQKNTTWIMVMGHHPVLSTGPEGEAARLQYVDDMYKSGRPRGLESQLVQLLFLHYQVDMYISGHDYFMEYDSIRDLDENVTVSFITSGAGARLLHRHLGQGWAGRLRGALYPVLCWTGKKILFALNPGGCKPNKRERLQPLSFYAPPRGNYEFRIEERLTRTTGFATLKLSKESMLVDFIDSRTGRTATPTVHRNSNKTGRDAKFLDPYAAARLKYEELLLDREAFAVENKERIQKEAELQQRCPILAQRLEFHSGEINEIVEQYDNLAQQKDTYETMDDNMRQMMLAQGVNVPIKVDQIISDMYRLSHDHLRHEETYKVLLQLKNLPCREDEPRWAELFELEKQYAAAQKVRRELLDRLTAGNVADTRETEEEYEKQVKLLKLLRKDIDDLEGSIQKNPHKDRGKDTVSHGPVERKKDHIKSAMPLIPEIKPLDTSLESRIANKEKLLQHHRDLLYELQNEPEGDLQKWEAEITLLRRQEDSIRRELLRLRQLRNRAERPMLPSTVWKKFQAKEEIETKLRQIRAYLNHVMTMPARSRHAPDTQAQVDAVEVEKEQAEKDLLAIVDELSDRKMTPLQQLFLETESELRRNHLVLEQRHNLAPATLALPDVQSALQKAEEKQEKLQWQLGQLHEQLLKELQELDSDWKKDMEQKGIATAIEEEETIGPDVETITTEEAAKVVNSGKVETAVSNIQQLEELKYTLAGLKAALEQTRSGSSDDNRQIEEAWGNVEKMQNRVIDLEHQISALEQKVQETEHQLERDAPVGKKKSTENGSEVRNLAEILEMFQEKREPTPYKKLEKIDTGETDPCKRRPFLAVAVEQILKPAAGVEEKQECLYTLANKAYREQLRYVHPGIFLSQSQAGMTPILFDQPSTHVSRMWELYFGYSHLSRFKCIMKDLRSDLNWVTENIKMLTFEDIVRLRQEEMQRRSEEVQVPHGGIEIEWQLPDVEEAQGESTES